MQIKKTLFSPTIVCNLKKAFAILLLTLLLFNLVGYRLLVNYLQAKAQATMVERLDQGAYNPDSLIEFTIALNLPYAPSNSEFERCDGTVEVDGITYSYVERKIENGTLVLHCLPNKNSDNIRLAGVEYSKSVNDIQPEKKGQKSNTAGLLLKSLECDAYKTQTGLAEIDHMFFTKQLAAYRSTSEKIVTDRFAKSPEQPPDTIA